MSGGRAVFVHDLPVKRGGRKEESRTESDLPGSELALTYVPPLRKRGYLFQAKVLDGLCVQTYRFSYKLLFLVTHGAPLSSDWLIVATFKRGRA